MAWWRCLGETDNWVAPCCCTLTILYVCIFIHREIFHVLDLMKLDMANYKLSILRPQILQQSVDYERQKFREYLTANPNGLLSTKEWIKKGQDVARNEQNRISQGTSGINDDNSGHTGTSSENCQHEGTTNVTLVDICRHCYVGILLGEGGFPFPEVQKCFVMGAHWLKPLTNLVVEACTIILCMLLHMTIILSQSDSKLFPAQVHVVV